MSLLAIYCAFEIKQKLQFKQQSYLGVFYCKEPTTSRIQVFPHEKALEDGGDKKHQLNRKKPSRVVGDKARKERKCTTNCANYWTKEREKLNNI